MVLSPALVLTFFGLGVGCITYTFFEPSFAKELVDRMGATETQIGLMFALPALPYALSAPLSGRLADMYGCKVGGCGCSCAW